jgi:hypothetical protein
LSSRFRPIAAIQFDFADCQGYPDSQDNPD